MFLRFSRIFFFIPSLFFLFTLFLSAGELPFDCGKYAFSHFDLKYRGNSRMGFDQGYSTASIFVTPSFKHFGVPFFDGRAHIFNNSYFASNLGVGTRVSNKSGAFVFGSNMYYDYSPYAEASFLSSA